MPVRLVKAPVWRTGASTGPACAVPMAERQGRCATAGRAVRAQREGFRGKTAYLPHRQQGQPRLSTHTEPCHTPRRAYPNLLAGFGALRGWFFLVLRPKVRLGSTRQNQLPILGSFATPDRATIAPLPHYGLQVSTLREASGMCSVSVGPPARSRAARW